MNPTLHHHYYQNGGSCIIAIHFVQSLGRLYMHRILRKVMKVVNLYYWGLIYKIYREDTSPFSTWLPIATTANCMHLLVSINQSIKFYLCVTCACTQPALLVSQPLWELKFIDLIESYLSQQEQPQRMAIPMHATDQTITTLSPVDQRMETPAITTLSPVDQRMETPAITTLSPVDQRMETPAIMTLSPVDQRMETPAITTLSPVDQRMETPAITTLSPVDQRMETPAITTLSPVDQRMGTPAITTLSPVDQRMGTPAITTLSPVDQRMGTPAITTLSPVDQRMASLVTQKITQVYQYGQLLLMSITLNPDYTVSVICTHMYLTHPFQLACGHI